MLTLVTDRLILRNYNEKDFGHIKKILSNERVCEYEDFHPMSDEEGHHCIDYDFDPEYGGNGYATEAAKELIYYLFDTVGVTAVYGDCDVRNESSWKLLERLGFQKMQKLENQLYKNDLSGKPIIIDTYLYKL